MLTSSRLFALVLSSLSFSLSTCSARLRSGDAAYRHDIIYNQPFYPSLKEHDESSDEVLAELRRLYADEGAPKIFIPMMAAYFGDPEFAMDVIEKAEKAESSHIYAGLEDLWSPVMHEVRQLPRFQKIVREVGLVDYWEQFGWPDLCKPIGDGDFVCE